MIRLVTRADDAASCLAANRAIEEALDAGCLRNVSVLACGPALADAATRFAGRPGINVGLHFALASEWNSPHTWGPLSGSELLCDPRGVFPPLPSALPRTAEAIDAMLAEADAQLVALKAAGFAPVYVDEHMATSTWAVPRLKRPLQAWARRNRLLFAEKVRTLPGKPDHGLIARIRAARVGDFVWVNHPGFDEPEMQAMFNDDYAPGQIAAERDAERLQWLDPELSALAAGGLVRFVRYDQVLAI